MALKILNSEPWFNLSSVAKVPTEFTVKKHSAPAQINMIQLVNWLFDMPNGGVDLITYNYLFDLFKTEGAAHYQKLSVNASQTLVGNSGLNLNKWLHSNTTSAKKYATSLQPGTDRTEYNLLIAETLPLVIRRVREMVAVCYTLCSIYRQGNSKVGYYDLNIKETGAKLYSVSPRTFSSYQRCQEIFNFSEVLTEGILQKHLLARQVKDSQAVSQSNVITVETFRFQDVYSDIVSVWNELHTQYSIVRACLKRMPTDIRIATTPQTTHTTLRNWILHICKEKKIEIPGGKIMMNSPIYSMVADAISLHFETPIHQKRPIQIIIDVGEPLKTGVRPTRSTELRRRRREKAAKRAAKKEIAESQAAEQQTANPDQGLPNVAANSSDHESSAFNDGGDEGEHVEEGEVEDDEAPAIRNDAGHESSELEDVYG